MGKKGYRERFVNEQEGSKWLCHMDAANLIYARIWPALGSRGKTAFFVLQHIVFAHLSIMIFMSRAI